MYICPKITFGPITNKQQNNTVLHILSKSEISTEEQNSNKLKLKKKIKEFRKIRFHWVLWMCMHVFENKPYIGKTLNTLVTVSATDAKIQ